MTLNQGESIGPFVIAREIGRGGMGVVYLARDTRLDRDVAIKSLPEHLASDADRLARFEREAKALAQLHHVNVAGIHGVEEADGHRYLILEYVDGETLAERLDRGSIPVDEAVEIAKQIASGVEAAHEAGVIHRDLKPANIKFDADGHAKILDFGLARADESSTSGSSVSQLPTLTSPAHSPTIAGVILGTAAYMSPEQARGRKVDKRTDIWSFGVVLYEMLTGAGPFRGETVTDSIGAILHKDVDLGALPQETPSGVRRILQGCLERDKSSRYRDIGDVRLDLIRSHDEQASVVQAQTNKGIHMGVLLVFAVLMLGAGLVGGRFSAPSTTAPVVKTDVLVEANPSEFDAVDLQISPDGRQLAIVKGGVILIRDVDSFGARVLNGTDGAINVFWSPDGSMVGYHDDSHVYKAPINGGSPIRVTSRPLELERISGGGWLDDGRIIIAQADSDIMQVPSQGGDPTLFRSLDPENDIDFHELSIGYGADFVLYVRHHSVNEFSLCADDGADVVEILAGSDTLLSSAAYSPTGHVLFSRGFEEPTLWAVAFDAKSMQATGEPFLVEPNSSVASVSRNGTLAVLRGSRISGDRLAWMGRDGAIEEFGESYPSIFRFVLSNDESKVSFTAGSLEGTQFDVWVHDVERGMDSRITFHDGVVMTGEWSSDDTMLSTSRMDTDSSSRSSTRAIYADGSGEAGDDIDGVIMSYDDQWKRAVLMPAPFAPQQVFQVISMDNPDEVLFELREEEHEYSSVQLHPDGSMLVYESNESGTPQVYCVRIDGQRGRWQLSRSEGADPRWSADGTAVYFNQDDSRVVRVAMTNDPDIAFGPPEVLFTLDQPELSIDTSMWQISADEQRLLVIKQLVSDNETPRAVSIIQNWHEQFSGN